MSQTASTKETKAPAYLLRAFIKTPRAKAQWKEITPIARRDFITWIESAKQEETRMRRIEVACSKLAAGKRRPCCYAAVPMELYTALNRNPKAKAQWKGLSPDEKRDIANWVESKPKGEKRKEYINTICAALAAGERLPRSMRK